MIISDFFKALGQLPDPRFRKVLLLGVAWTIALLVGVYALILMVIEGLVGEGITLPWMDQPVNWVGDMLGWGSLGLMLVLSVFLMVPIASAISSLFLENVAQAVEDKHYPHLPGVPKIPFAEGLRDAATFLAVLIGANMLAIFVYMILPFLSVAIFYALNGYLLGREYFQLVAMRRIGRAAAQDLRKTHKHTVWIAGCLMAVPLTIPVVNLVVPILGVATFTHLFHRLTAR